MATVLVALACTGCVRSADPLVPESDVLGIAVVLVAGRSDVNLLAMHPHRPQSGPAPAVELSLIGPGWEAAFSEEVDPADCRMAGADTWPGTFVCLRAQLPEAIRERTRYRLSGSGPEGPISGETVVPSAPVIVEPADGQVFPPIHTDDDDFVVPIRFDVPADVATLHSEVVDAVEIQSDGVQEPVGPMSCQPMVLDTQAGLAELRLSRASPSLYKRLYLGQPVELSLRLLGLGRHYANFFEVSGRYPARQPWPSFGLDGAYGYFAGAAPSRPVRIIVRRTDAADTLPARRLGAHAGPSTDRYGNR